MHLLIPHASALDDAARQALGSLALPNLGALLARLTPTDTWGSDAYSPHPPHHLALAALHGQAEPSVAAWAAADPQRAWAELTPVHLAVGTDGVDLLPPAALRLSDAESADLATALQELWSAADGWQWRSLSATRWLVGHAQALDGLHAASIERAAGRPIEPWLPESRVLRRWQNEAQMRLHHHPVNTAREARGAHAVNSVWISGIGRANGLNPAQGSTGAPPDLTVDARLTEPLLNGDLAAWAEAWQQLDAGPLAQPLTTLTLCGERLAQRFEAKPQSLLARLQRRWRQAEPAQILEAL